MKTISFYDALLGFNERILHEGIIEEDKNYSFEELLNRIKFDEIFCSNMNEMFQKYSVNKIKSKYLSMRKIMFNSINSALNIIDDIETNDEISDDLYSFIKLNSKEVKDNSFDQSQIYYLMISSSSMKIIYFDKNIFNEIIDRFGISYLYKYKFKIESMISEILLSIYKSQYIVPFKITYKGDPSKFHNVSSISKIEYMVKSNGDIINIQSKMIDIFTNIFNPNQNNILITYTSILSFDGIKYAISRYIKNDRKEIPKIKNISFNDIFDHDILLEYPHDSFDSFLNLLDIASKSPDIVSGISITLYRIGDSHRIPDILKRAKINGIKVNVNMELNASGEFVRNDAWRRYFESNGIRVSTFGSTMGIKVHSKICLITFKNGKKIAQIGTGNYHTSTTKLYTDLSLMTSDEKITRSIEMLFKYFKSGDNSYNNFNNDFLVTRFNLKKKLLKMIESESIKGSNGYICIKCNTMDDPDIINALDDAATNGCKILLLIRGACTWVPDIYSDVIIKSIIWDKLEHSRIYVFGNTNPLIYIGSLDPVSNKLNNRIETLVKIKDIDILIKIIEYLNKYITNTTNCWVMNKSGNYYKIEE